MNKIKEWFKERNNWHYLVGALLAFVFYMISFEAVQIIGRILISGIFTFISAYIWEMVREDIKKYKFDKQDVIRSMIGWLIGIIITVIIHLIIK